MSEEKFLLVKSAVAEYVHTKDLKLSDEFQGALNKKLKVIIDDACKRCEGNGRKTVMDKDV